MNDSVDPPIGHNGGPPLDEPVAPGRPQCKWCRHWQAPSEWEQRAYETFRLGLSRRRVKRPSGSCDRVLTAPGKPVSFSATVAEFGCLNFSAIPPVSSPQVTNAFVTIYEGGQIVWQGSEDKMPAHHRQEALNLPAPVPGARPQGE